MMQGTHITGTVGVVAQPVPRPRQAGCCETHTNRWAVALLVCSILTMISVAITAMITGWWTGPSYTVMEAFVIINSAVLIALSSVKVCECCGSEALKSTAVASAVFCSVALIAVITWASSVESGARYNCRLQMTCDFMAPAGIFQNDCHKANQRYVACSNPDVDHDSNGDLYFSIWGDDCYEDGGDDDTCRGFTSITDCVNYINPLDDDDECDKNGQTVKDAIRGLAYVLSGLTVLTVIPAFGLAISVFFCHGGRGTAPVLHTAPVYSMPHVAEGVEMANSVHIVVQPAEPASSASSNARAAREPYVDDGAVIAK